MKLIKNIITTLLMLLLCFLCITCIIFLNKESSSKESELDLSNAEKNTYTEYSKVFLGYMDLQQFVKVEGQITSTTEEFLEAVQFDGDSSNLLFAQGDIFHKGDVLFKNATQIYTAKYDGKIDRIHSSDQTTSIILSNYSNRVISLNVPFEYAPYLKYGEEIRFLYNNVEHIGNVSYASTTVIDGHMAVEICFDDTKLELLLNAPVEVIVVKASALNVIAVPQSALISSGDIYYVRIVGDDGSAELVQVETGLVSSDGYVEIINGLSEDNVVLVDGTVNLVADE